MGSLLGNQVVVDQSSYELGCGLWIWKLLCVFPHLSRVSRLVICGLTFTISGTYSNYLCEVTLHSNSYIQATGKEWTKGFWKSTWQDIGGPWIGYDVFRFVQQHENLRFCFSEEQYAIESAEVYKQSLGDQPMEKFLIGAWEGFVSLDMSENTTGLPSQFKVGFTIAHCLHRGLKGHVLRQDYFKEIRLGSLRYLVFFELTLI